MRQQNGVVNTCSHTRSRLRSACAPYGVNISPHSTQPFSLLTAEGTPGIGLAIAKKLAQAPGHLCVLTSRNPALGQKAADDLKGEGLDSVVYKQLDIGDPDSVEVRVC